MQPTLVVMAAGLGSRYGGIKQLDPVGASGETLLEFGLYDALESGFGDVVFIVRRQIEEDFRRHVLSRIGGRFPYRLVLQDPADLPGGPRDPDRTKPWGTAHAVWSARNAVGGPFAVMNADDFYGRQSFELLGSWLAGVDPDLPQYALAGYRIDRTLSDHGTVSRGLCAVDAGGFLTRIEEHPRLEADGDAILSHRADGTRVRIPRDASVSMNLFGFTPKVFDQLGRALGEFLTDPGRRPQAECYLPEVVGALVRRGQASVRILPSPEAWFGVTYQADRPLVTRQIAGLTESGLYPRRLWGH